MTHVATYMEGWSTGTNIYQITISHYLNKPIYAANNPLLASGRFATMTYSLPLHNALSDVRSR